MSTTTRLYNSTMGSVQKLEDRCNFDELNLPGKLQSLTAGTDTAGVKVTEAVYEDIAEPVGVGNLQLSEGGSNSAWIMTVKRNILISRDE